MANIEEMRKILAEKYKDNQGQMARMTHFVGLLKAGMEGLISMGIVVYVDAEGLEDTEPTPESPNVMESVETAVKFMQEASKNATH